MYDRNNSMTTSKFSATVLIYAYVLAVLSTIVFAPLVQREEIFQYYYENSFDIKTHRPRSLGSHFF